MKTTIRFSLTVLACVCAAMPGFADDGPTPVATDIFAELSGMNVLAETPELRDADGSPPATPNGHDGALAPKLPPGFDDEEPPPVTAGMAEHQPERLAEMYDRVLDLEPDAQNRRLIERVRAATLATEVGVDTSREEWVHVKDKSLTWGGRILGDWVNWANDSQFEGEFNYVEFRSLRLFAAGEGYGVYDYQLEFEFAPALTSHATVVDNQVELGDFGVEVKDAYVGICDLPLLGYLRFGHFKTPLSLEKQTLHLYTTFLERSLPDRLVPGRELGMAAFNHSWDENVTWAYGAFFDDMSESLHAIEGDHQGVRLAGRATWTPYYDPLSEGRYLLHTGLGYSYARPRKQEGPLAPGLEYRPVRFDARPEIHRGDPLIDTGEINTRQYHLLNGELAWVHGSFSVQSELIWANLQRMDGGATDLYGTYVFASYFLTGEHRAYDRLAARFERVTPYENFWIVNTPHGRRAGWGAWEVAARWSYLDFSEVDRQRLHDLTIGCNWYWNPQTRMMLNWIHPFAHDSPVADTADSQGDIVALRLQVDF